MRRAVVVFVVLAMAGVAQAVPIVDFYDHGVDHLLPPDMWQFCIFGAAIPTTAGPLPWESIAAAEDWFIFDDDASYTVLRHMYVVDDMSIRVDDAAGNLLLLSSYSQPFTGDDNLKAVTWSVPDDLIGVTDGRFWFVGRNLPYQWPSSEWIWSTPAPGALGLVLLGLAVVRSRICRNRL